MEEEEYEEEGAVRAGGVRRKRIMGRREERGGVGMRMDAEEDEEG